MDATGVDGAEVNVPAILRKERVPQFTSDPLIYARHCQAFNGAILEGWERIRAIRKPLIAAVNGFALGGGCELAMLADIIVASENASFGQVRRVYMGCL